MSQPKRYYFTSHNINGVNIGVEMHEDDKGSFITYSDYAALAAENERLRKAGDELANLIWWEDPVYSDIMKVTQGWKAAKEGRDAK